MVIIFCTGCKTIIGKKVRLLTLVDKSIKAAYKRRYPDGED